jgi:hypothetical protein
MIKSLIVYDQLIFHNRFTDSTERNNTELCLGCELWIHGFESLSLHCYIGALFSISYVGGEIFQYVDSPCNRFCEILTD